MAKGTKSLGTLYVAEKTKDRSPDMKGTIKIKRKHLQEMGRQVIGDESDEVKANLAAWSNIDGSNRRFLTIELQPVTTYEAARKSNDDTKNIFDFLDNMP